MKNRRGSTFILTLIVFVFLSILSIATLSFMVSENKQSLVHKDGIEAYYIARSGAEAVEAAMLQVDKKANAKEEELEKKVSEIKNDDSKKEDEKKEDIGRLKYEFKEKPEIKNKVDMDEMIKKIPIDGLKQIDLGFAKTDEEDNIRFKENEGVKVYLKKDKDGSLIIESKGTIDKNSKTVEKVMEKHTISSSGSLDIKYPVYASKNLEVENKVKVITKPEKKIAYGEEFIGKDIKKYIPGGVEKVDPKDFYYPPVEIDIGESNSIKDEIDSKIEEIKKDSKTIKVTAKEMKEMFENNTFLNSEDINYYIGEKKDIDLEFEKDIINCNIYTKGRIIIGSGESKNLTLKGALISSYEGKGEAITLNIDKKQDSNIIIDNSMIKAKNKIKIKNRNKENKEVDKMRKQIKIIDSTIKSSDDVEIEIENESEKKGDLEGEIIIQGSTIISNDDVEIEIENENKTGKLIGNIIITDSNIEAKNEIEIEIEIENGNKKSKESSGYIKISKSTIGSKDEIEIELDDIKGDIELIESIIKSKDEIEIEVDDGDIILNKTDLWADKEIELEAKKGNITINKSIYAPNAEIEIETEKFKMNNGVIIGKNIELKKGEFIIKEWENPDIVIDLENIESFDRYKPGYYR